MSSIYSNPLRTTDNLESSYCKSRSNLGPLNLIAVVWVVASDLQVNLRIFLLSINLKVQILVKYGGTRYSLIILQEKDKGFWNVLVREMGKITPCF